MLYYVENGLDYHTDKHIKHKLNNTRIANQKNLNTQTQAYLRETTVQLTCTCVCTTQTYIDMMICSGVDDGRKY